MFYSFKVKGRLKKLSTGDQQTILEAARWLAERRVAAAIVPIIKKLVSLPSKGSTFENELIKFLSVYEKKALPQALSAWEIWRVNGLTNYFLSNRDISIEFLKPTFLMVS